MSQRPPLGPSLKPNPPLRLLGPDPMPTPSSAWLGRNAMGRRFVARQVNPHMWGVRDERTGAFYCDCKPYSDAERQAKNGEPMPNSKDRAQKLARLLNGERR